MRKVALLLCLSILLCCILTSCGMHQLGESIDGDDRYRLHTKMDTSQLQFTYEDQGKSVGVYYLGRVSNVPFAPSKELAHEKGKIEQLIYEKDDFSESNFAASKSLAISQIISNDIEKTVVYTAPSGAVGLAAVASNPTVDRQFNISKALSSGVDATSAYAFADSFETAQAFVKSKRISQIYLTVKTGIFSEESLLRISLFADCDVYAFAAYNSQTNTVSVTYDLAIVESSLAFRQEIGENAGFAANEENKGYLKFDTSVLSSGVISGNPETYSITYMPNGGVFTTTPILTYTQAGASLSTPEMPYFDFGGWYFDEALTQPATAETLSQKASDVTLYAKWNTQTDILTYAGFTGVTSNIKGEETGKTNSARVETEKIQAYIEKGYTAKVTYYYTIGVPVEYEETKDPSDLKVQIGIAKDSNATDFIELAQKYHSNVAPGSTSSHSLSFTLDLSYLTNHWVTARLVILSNDTAVFGICGRDAGTYSSLKMVIEYVK